MTAKKKIKRQPARIPKRTLTKDEIKRSYDRFNRTYTPNIFRDEVIKSLDRPRIVSVSYRANIQVGRFQYVHMEATAATNGGPPADALMRAKRFVDSNLKLLQMTAYRQSRRPEPAIGRLPDVAMDPPDPDDDGLRWDGQ
jgi:hypothetical protein